MISFRLSIVLFAGYDLFHFPFRLIVLSCCQPELLILHCYAIFLFAFPLFLWSHLYFQEAGWSFDFVLPGCFVPGAIVPGSHPVFLFLYDAKPFFAYWLFPFLMPFFAGTSPGSPLKKFWHSLRLPAIFPWLQKSLCPVLPCH